MGRCVRRIAVVVLRSELPLEQKQCPKTEPFEKETTKVALKKKAKGNQKEVVSATGEVC